VVIADEPEEVRPTTRRANFWSSLRRLVGAVRDADRAEIEQTLREVGGSRRMLAPLGYVAGGFALLFDGLKLLVLNWRLSLIEIVPAVWIWLTLWDLKAHFLHGREFYIVRGPMAFVVAAVVVLVTTTAYACNAVFAFAVSGPQPPRIRPAITAAMRHRRLIIGWGVAVGLAHAVSTVFLARYGLRWFTISLGSVFVVMSVTFISVPARLIGEEKPPKLPLKQAISHTAAGGAMSAVLTSPGFLLNRVGLLMFGVHALQIPAIIVYSIGVALQAAATSSAKAVKLGSRFGAVAS
jgi:hypothetical protein